MNDSDIKDATLALSNQKEFLRPAATRLIGMTLRRAVLAAAGNLDDLQARIDCAELALALDLRSEARTLFEIAFIPGGYDGGALATQERLRRETSLWAGSALRPGAPEGKVTSHQSRINGAAADLASCLAFEAAEIHARAEEDRPGTPANNENLSAWAVDVAGLVHALHLALRGPLDSIRLADAIRSMTAHPLVRSNATAREHVDAPIDALIGLFAAEAMRFFLQQRHVVFRGRLASPALAHKAAGLEQAGLGPWFTRACNLVPDMRGLIGLAAAAQTTGGSDNSLQHALVLLSAGLGDHALADLVDVLADEGLLVSLDLIAERFRIAASAENRPVLFRLRDAALDFGELRLAVEMQTLILKLSPFSSVEAEILTQLQTTNVTKGYNSTTGRRNLRRAKAYALRDIADET